MTNSAVIITLYFSNLKRQNYCFREKINYLYNQHFCKENWWLKDVSKIGKELCSCSLFLFFSIFYFVFKCPCWQSGNCEFCWLHQSVFIRFQCQVSLFVYLSIHQFVCLFVCLSVHLSTCLLVYLSVRLSICLFISSSVYLSIRLSVCLFVCLCVCFFIYFSIRQFVGVFVCLYISLLVCLFVYESICLLVCLLACLFVYLSVSVPSLSKHDSLIKNNKILSLKYVSF